ncbi:MAG: protoporphyrinogen/coproporphyrinogen oxidase [Armatimonadota bacterium]
MKIIVVGAGLAGLACALRLAGTGCEVLLLESSDSVGGRVRTDVVDGFRLDRGFQVLFTEYPSLPNVVDIGALELRRYDPGALIAQGDRLHVFSDPARDPDSLRAALLSNVVPFADKLRAWRLSAELSAKPVSAILDGPDQTIERFLRRRGFSERFLETFARPFFGGIFLDRTLAASAQRFQYYWKMLVDGETAVPALGMGELPRAMARALEVSIEIRTGSAVTGLMRRAGKVVGVETADGNLPADAVVLATDPRTAATLSGLPFPTDTRGVDTVWIATTEPVVPGRKIVLHANQAPIVNHFAPVSNVAPDTAPEGWHLGAACVLARSSHDDESLGRSVLADCARMFSGDARSLRALRDARIVAIHRIPHAQCFAAPGQHMMRVPTDPGIPGLRLAGEAIGGASIDGAIRSGIDAASSLLELANPGTNPTTTG